jgi:hypothetical protein
LEIATEGNRLSESQQTILFNAAGEIAAGAK